MQLEALIGQRLRRIDVLEPMAVSQSSRYSQKGSPPLSGALVLRFESAALICVSPLRYMRNQGGTMVGLPNGECATLGYRMTLCPNEDVGSVLPARFGLTWSEDHWYTWSPSADLAIGSVLSQVGFSAELISGAIPTWGMELNFRGASVMRIQYRRDIDGSVERSAPSEHFILDRIVVDGPEQDFGWLHPAAPLDFFLGERWRSAKIEDWPLALRKALQSHRNPDDCYRATLSKALQARFLQRPHYMRRLLALSLPVEVKYVPNGLFDELVTNFRRLSLAESCV